MNGDCATGDFTHTSFPAHPDALRRGGIDFLTTAFRASGTLEPRETVTRISRFQEVSGGSTGRKVLLDVEYDRTGPALPTELFVKFSRDFDDPVRDHGRDPDGLRGAIRARCRRRRTFPIVVPSTQFADYHGESGTGILITERIAFGTGGIEPQYEKCLDNEMPDPIGHYRALLTALADWRGHIVPVRCRATSPTSFPWTCARPRSASRDHLSRSSCPSARRARRVRRRLSGSATRKRPRRLASWRALSRQAHDVMRRPSRRSGTPASDPTTSASATGTPTSTTPGSGATRRASSQCGLMDWGCVGQMNVAMAVWGCLCAAETAMWNTHLDELLQLVCTEAHDSGGPCMEPAVLAAHLQVYVALMGITWLLHVPALIRQRVPDADPEITPNDPRIAGEEASARRCSCSRTSSISGRQGIWMRHSMPSNGPKLRRGERVVRVNGGDVVYEILGTSGELIVLTPGGRFGKDIPGLRPLAKALVAGGYRVLLWDRPTAASPRFGSTGSPNHTCGPRHCRRCSRRWRLARASWRADRAAHGIRC